MRPCVSVESFTSVQLAIERMREVGQELIPIITDGKVEGVLTEQGILKYVAEGGSPNDSVTVYSEPAPTILNRLSGPEVLRELERKSCLVVIDEHHTLCGLITPSCFVAAQQEQARPAMVGGMATPFGVYLTSGAVNGGKGGWNLVGTGFFLITPVLIGGLIAEWLTKFLPNTEAANALLSVVSFLPMLLLFRVHPISGYHAAEHQVVHALERDEDLTPEVVARMPRVHPRCGTNLAAAVGIFSIIAFGPWSNDGTRKEWIFPALLVTLFTWRSVGSLAQYWVTTKKPNQKQVESGVAAAKELLANYQVAPNRTATPWLRIVNSGLLHVIAGSTLASGIAELIARVFFGVSLIF